MHNKTIIAVLAAACLSASGAVLAQDDHREQRDDHREHAEAAHAEEHGYEEGRRNDRRDYQPVERVEHGPRGAGPRHDMIKGGRLAAEYRGRQYVVDDWRGHHLSAPPRGMHWVQTGSDYVLVAITTGIIADILLNN